MFITTVTVWILTGMLSLGGHTGAAPPQTQFATKASCEVVLQASMDLAKNSALRCVPAEIRSTK